MRQKIQIFKSTIDCIKQEALHSGRVRREKVFVVVKRVAVYEHLHLFRVHHICGMLLVV